MPRRHRKNGRLGPPDSGALMLSLANRVSAMGTAVVVIVGLALAVIIEQAVLPSAAQHPVGDRRHAPGGHAQPRRTPPSRSATRPVQASPATLLSRKVEKVTLTERSRQLRKEFGVGRVSPPVVRVSRIDRARTWAFGTEAIPQPKGMTSMPDSSLYLARRAAAGWQVALAGTDRFAALLRKAPASVVPAAERTVLARYNTAAKVTGDTGLMLPWAVGQSWSLMSTDAGVSGFDGGDGRVLAAGDGRLYRLCATAAGHGLVLIIHPNGLASEYYQLSDVTRVRDGSLVKRGDYLGRTSTEQPCGGGPAAQRMARFAIRNADTGIPLDQVTVGGWTLHQTQAATFAERTGLRVDAGNPLLNFGAMTLPTPSAKPTAPGNGKKGGKAGNTPELPPPANGNGNGNGDR